MCAFTLNPETSQFIDPPPGSVIGEKITFEGYKGVYVYISALFVFCSCHYGVLILCYIMHILL